MLYILLDSSTPLCTLDIVTEDGTTTYEWQADRGLADGLLAYMENILHAHQATWNDITGLGVMKGPGSFTGLRIGITVANTLAETCGVPIVGTSGTDWKEDAVSKLSRGISDRLVMPEYGKPANITKRRK